jgi:hypothetical protein
VGQIKGSIANLARNSAVAKPYPQARVKSLGCFMTQRHSVQTQFGDYLERMNISDPYPDYTRGERIADGAVHAAGIVFAIVATILLIVAASGETSVGTVVALSIYGAALIGSFIASACYHFTPWDRPRALLRRIDHAAIYLKIAGTYTPLVVLIGSAFAYSVLGLVWALAAVGAIAKLFFWALPRAWLAQRRARVLADPAGVWSDAGPDRRGRIGLFFGRDCVQHRQAALPKRDLA